MRLVFYASSPESKRLREEQANLENDTERNAQKFSEDSKEFNTKVLKD